MGFKKKEHKEPKEKKKGLVRRLYQNKPWVFWGVLLSFVGAVLFSCFYGMFRSHAEYYSGSQIENSGNISWLYQSCYLLYRDLYNAQHEEQLDYADIYLEMNEDYQWILDGSQSQLSTEEYMDSLQMDQEYYEVYEEQWHQLILSLIELQEEGLLNDEQMSFLLYLREEWEERLGEINEEQLLQNSLDSREYNILLDEIDNMKGYFQNLEGNFRSLNSNYDYVIRDNSTGKYVTNVSSDDVPLKLENQYFLLSFIFDSAGNVTIGNAVCNENENQIRKLANEVIRENAWTELIAHNMPNISRYGNIKQPVDCTVTFAISYADWYDRGRNNYEGKIIDVSYGGYISYMYADNSGTLQAYRESGAGGLLFLFLLSMAALGVFLPTLRGTKPWKEERICRFPFELLYAIGCCVCVSGEIMLELVAAVASGRANEVLLRYTSNNEKFLVMCFNLLALTLFFFCGWYLGICARAFTELGIKGYIKQRSLIYRFFPYMKRKAVDAYEKVLHLDLTQNAHKTIIKILCVNAVILLIISSLWFGGFAITLVYSVVLYVILRKYVSDLQKKYGILLKAVDEIAQGNLNVTINEDLGVFEPFRTQVFKIQDGLKKAVDTEVKSQRIKTELITNMSHDLKTPLTAIITYVNLLKEENDEQKRREYLATLERKSLRLKSLIEDLFEFSKANSQNITLNIMDIDIMNLVKQVGFEMSDKISESGLDVRMNLTDEKIILPLDSQKTYRIYENLFANIAKYALFGTRVYVNGFRIDDAVVITLKNISAEEITVEPNELTERFVRGDASRNTEGSGLGLAIAKSFMELQGGNLALEVDGDLFKVTTTWYVKKGSEQDKSITCI